MDKVFIKKNTLGDTRTAEYMPSREEFNDANERHIEDVKNLTMSFCDEMLKRISQHDWTKMSEPYATMFYDNMKANIEDGKEPFTDMEWYKLHVSTERHHLNDRVPDDVDLIDVVERLVDCVSAGMARSGSVYDVTVPDDVLQKAVANTVKKLIDAVIVYKSVDDLVDYWIGGKTMRLGQIKHNRIRCKKCGDVIESKTRHDFVVCRCGACGVDGGHDYAKRVWDGKANSPYEVYEDLTEYVEDESND